MADLTLNITLCPIHTICETNVSGATISSSGYSKISAGTLQLTSGTIGNYLIEWRLNAVDGEILFISGNSGNLDNLISNYHPFVDEIVPGGVIFPVIKYVYVNGVKYDGYYVEGGNYSPDLRLCLTSTTVDSMTCDNGSGGTYSHTLSYSHINPNGSSSRTLIFDLANDGSEKYFAFNFYGDKVADMLKVYGVTDSVVDIEEHLIGIVAGSNQTIDGLITNGDPLYVSGENNYRISTNNYQYVINLSGVSCDYIKLEITSSVDFPANTATIWNLQLKCLTGWTSCDQYIVNTGWTTPDVDGITLTWDSANCRYVFTVNPTSAKVVDPYYTNYIDNYNYGIYNKRTGETDERWIDFKKIGNTSLTSINATCHTLTDTVTLQKITSEQKLRITFTNSTDFNHFKTKYDTIKADPLISNYVNDSTNINFYKYIYFYQDFRDINCTEDGSTVRNLSFHVSSPVVFNNVPGNYYMDIFTHTNASDPLNLYLPHYPISNGLTPDGCDEVYEAASGALAYGNSLYYVSNFTDTTKYTLLSVYGGGYMVTGSTSGSTTFMYYYNDFSKIAVDEVCPSFSGSIYDDNAYSVSNCFWFDTGYRFYKYGLKFVLTGADKTNGNSVNSYDVYRVINPTTGLIDQTGASDVLIKSVTP